MQPGALLFWLSKISLLRLRIGSACTHYAQVFWLGAIQVQGSEVRLQALECPLQGEAAIRVYDA